MAVCATLPPTSTSYPAMPTLSVAAFHFNVTDVLVRAVDIRSVGAVGGAASPLSEVVTVTAFDGVDALPAASLAMTVNVYAVSAVRPSTVTVVPAGAATTVVPLRTSYPLTATLSVAASHASDTLDAVRPVVRRLPGTVGACVSGGAAPADLRNSDCSGSVLVSSRPWPPV